MKTVPCSGWESKTRQIWNILKPQSKTCLYCNSLPSQRKYKQQTDKFKLLFSPLIPSKMGRDALCLKSGIFTSTVLLCLEKLPGYSSACTLPVVLRCTTEGRGPWAQARLGSAPCAHAVPPAQRHAQQRCLSVSRIRPVVEDLPRGFGMAMTALCQLLTVTKRGYFKSAELVRYKQQREAAALCPAA